MHFDNRIGQGNEGDGVGGATRCSLHFSTSASTQVDGAALADRLVTDVDASTTKIVGQPLEGLEAARLNSEQSVVGRAAALEFGNLSQHIGRASPGLDSDRTPGGTVSIGGEGREPSRASGSASPVEDCVGPIPLDQDWLFGLGAWGRGGAGAGETSHPSPTPGPMESAARPSAHIRIEIYGSRSNWSCPSTAWLRSIIVSIASGPGYESGVIPFAETGMPSVRNPDVDR